MEKSESGTLHGVQNKTIPFLGGGVGEGWCGRCATQSDVAS